MVELVRPRTTAPNYVLDASHPMMITLYDIASKLPQQAWSPNTLKARISLNYKGLPYKSEWIEYPDIEPMLKKLGGKPTDKKADGRDHYTLPAIHDSATGKVITDSKKIAEYLDETYPDKPSLFPPGTHAAIAVLEYVFRPLFAPIFPIIYPAAHDILNPRSAEYFRTTREKMYGKKLEEFAPPGPIREEAWKRLKENMEKLASFYDRNGEDKVYFLSDTFSFADAFVVSYMLWVKIVFGTDSEEWKAMAEWSNGRWSRLVEETKVNRFEQSRAPTLEDYAGTPLYKKDTTSPSCTSSLLEE